jgi:cold shock CspA family protein
MQPEGPRCIQVHDHVVDQQRAVRRHVKALEGEPQDGRLGLYRAHNAIQAESSDNGGSLTGGVADDCQAEAVAPESPKLGENVAIQAHACRPVGVFVLGERLEKVWINGFAAGRKHLGQIPLKAAQFAPHARLVRAPPLLTHGRGIHARAGSQLGAAGVQSRPVRTDERLIEVQQDRLDGGHCTSHDGTREQLASMGFSADPVARAARLLARDVRRIQTCWRSCMQGTIASLVPERGFGFIKGPEGQELFFHRKALLGTDFEELAEGQPVEFQVASEAQGDQRGERTRAVSVRLSEQATPAVDHEVLPPEKTG